MLIYSKLHRTANAMASEMQLFRFAKIYTAFSQVNSLCVYIKIKRNAHQNKHNVKINKIRHGAECDSYLQVKFPLHWVQKSHDLSKALIANLHLL